MSARPASASRTVPARARRFEPDPDLDPDLEPKPGVSTRGTGGERMKCERNPPRNAAKHQNASDSSGTLSRKHAATSFIPWQ